MNIGEVKASLGLDWSDMRQSLERAQSKIKEYDKTVRTELKQAEARFTKFAGEVKSTMARVNGPLSTFRNRMGSLGPAIAGAGGAFAAVGFIKKMADFERSLSTVEVVSQATEKQMNQLRKSAKKMGATTEFAASQAADAEKYLAMAGLDVQQTLDTLPKMLDLATAGQLDLANAADISTNVMSQFNMEVKELTDVNDALVAVQSTANTNIEEAANALTYAGAKAKSFNMDIEDTTSLIGLLANNGIKASKAGTTLRQGMQKLLAPTGETAEIMDKYNISVKKADGTMRNFVDILKDMADAGIDTTEMAEMLGARASNLTLIMNQGSDAIEDYNQEIRDMDGIAKSAAETIRNDMQGAIDKLTSRLESVGIAVWEEYKETIKTTTEDAAKWLGSHRQEIVETFDSVVQKANEIKNAALPAIKGVTSALQGVLSIYNSLPSGVTGPGTAGLVGYILFGPYGAAAFAGLSIGNAIADATDASIEYNNTIDARAQKIEQLKDKIKQLQELKETRQERFIDRESINKDIKSLQNELEILEKAQDLDKMRAGAYDETSGVRPPQFRDQRTGIDAMSEKWQDAFEKAKQTVANTETELKLYVQRAKSLNSIMEISNKRQSEAATKFENTKSEIRDQIKQVKMSEEEWAKYQAVQKLAKNATDQQKESVRQLVDKLYDLRDAQDATTPDDLIEKYEEKVKTVQMSEKAQDLYNAKQKISGDLNEKEAKQLKELIDKYHRLKDAKEENKGKDEADRISLAYKDVKENTDGMWEEMKLGGEAAFKELEESANNWAKNTKKIMSTAVDSMSQTIANFVTTGKMEWDDFGKSVINTITKIATKMMILQAIKGAATAFGGGGMSGGPSMYNAQGNVFSGGKVQAYANGGVVSQPTIFPMANGTGLMGEKGPEAVMPLTRTSGGDLGVKSENSSPNLQVNVINKTGEETQASKSEPSWDGEKWVMGVVLDAVNRNKNGFGKNLKGALNKQG